VLLFFKNLVFTAFVAGFVAGWLPFRLFERHARLPAAWAWHHWLGALLLLIGAGMFLGCVWLFGSYGRGTPAPIDAPKKLVQRGPYRWVRNPMYLAVLTIIAGEALFFRSWHIGIYLLCLACIFQLFVMLYEEPTLSFHFGALYEDYRRDVPRWLPRPPRPRP
jgi:protein-S-isoprenylcysteine O-methyltransferase Ste14